MNAAPLPSVSLRPLHDEDYAVFLGMLWDGPSAVMGAFATQDPDVATLRGRWDAVRDEGGVQRAVLFDGDLAGFIYTFHREGKPQVAYWIHRAHWGKGIASAALGQFLHVVVDRPLYASAIADNHGSLRVLAKNGFRITGQVRSFARHRGGDVDEVQMELLGL